VPSTGQKKLASNASGILQIDVTPSGEVDAGRWKQFKEKLKALFGRSPDEAAKDYLRVAEEAGREKLREPSVRNAHLEADIELKLAEARRANAEARLAEIEASRKEALNAIEVQAMKLDLQAEAFSKLRDLGIDMEPIVEGSELVGLLITKEKPAATVRLLSSPSPGRLKNETLE